MKRKARRYYEGGDIPDIDREPLRDSSGEIVRDSSGEAVMSGGSKKFDSGPKGYLDDDIRAPEGIQATLRKPPPGLVSPYNPSDKDLAEPGTAGFSRTPIKTPEIKKPITKPKAEAPKDTPKAEPASKKDVKAELERLKAYDKPLERVAPELSLLGGMPLRALKSAGAATKAAAQASKVRVEPTVPQEAVKALTTTAKSPKLLEVAKPKGGELATRSRELTKTGSTRPQIESAKGRLPYEKNMGKAKIETQFNKRRQLSGSRSSDDVIEMGMKRGGKVSSASSRGDGIAKRGKTRGRYL